MLEYSSLFIFLYDCVNIGISRKKIYLYKVALRFVKLQYFPDTFRYENFLQTNSVQEKPHEEQTRHYHDELRFTLSYVSKERN